MESRTELSKAVEKVQVLSKEQALSNFTKDLPQTEVKTRALLPIVPLELPPEEEPDKPNKSLLPQNNGGSFLTLNVGGGGQQPQTEDKTPDVTTKQYMKYVGIGIGVLFIAMLVIGWVKNNKS